MNLRRDELTAVLKGWKENGYGVLPSNPAESWSQVEAATAQYSKRDNPGRKWAMTLEYEKPTFAKDITDLVRALLGKIGKQKKPTVAQDAEWLLPRNARLVVKKVIENKKTRELRVIVGER